MGILNDVLQYKARKDAEKEAQANAIPQALMAFQQAKQQSQDNLLKQLTVQATLAKSGLAIGQDGRLVKDDSLNNLTNKNVYAVDSFGNLKSVGTVGSRDVVKQLPLDANAIKGRAEASRKAVTENPQLDDSTKKAIAAAQFINPRLDNALKILDGIGKDNFEKLATQIQIGANNEFLVPNGSPLEDLVAELNDSKITGFNIAGAAYTDTEKQTVEGGLNPIGKGFNRFKRDLVRNRDYFNSKIKAGTMGLEEARKLAKDKGVYSAGENKKSSSGKGVVEVGKQSSEMSYDEKIAYTMKKHNLSREEVLKRLKK